MNNSQRPHSGQNISATCPYDDLYIYQLGGRLTSQKEIPQKRFIGNWEEDDFSFLFFSEPAQVLKSWTHEGIWHTFYGENGSTNFLLRKNLR